MVKMVRFFIHLIDIAHHIIVFEYGIIVSVTLEPLAEFQKEQWSDFHKVNSIGELGNALMKCSHFKIPYSGC